MNKVRVSFRILPFAFCIASAVAAATAETRIVLDAPGHAVVEGAAIRALNAPEGSAWTVLDWRGRMVATNVERRADGMLALKPLGTGYYRLLCGGAEATLAVAPDPKARPLGCDLFYAVDSAQNWVSKKDSFDCPWNGGDTYRTVSDLIRLAGVQYVRDRMSWPENNPKPGVFKFEGVTSVLNAELLRERGIGVSGLFFYVPKWAGARKTGPLALPLDLEAVFAGCAGTAKGFGERMGDWEFWNEQDFNPTPDPVWDYAAAFKAASLGFKAGLPGVTVLHGALCQRPDSPYSEAMFANDAAKYCDVFNYHTYEPPSHYPAIFRAIRGLLARHEAEGMPVWITECGTYQEGDAQGRSPRKGQKTHSSGQELVLAEIYPKTQIAMLMEGCARNFHFLFGAYNEMNGAKDFGVMRRDGTVKPAFAAISAMTREVGAARLEGEMNVGDGLRAFLFRQPDDSQTIAFWSVSPVDEGKSALTSATPDYAKTLQLELPSRGSRSAFRLTDLCGMRSAVSATNGVLSLAATRFPAYVSGLDGLKADIPARQRGEIKARVPSDDEDMTVIIRVEFDEDDFGIANQKSRAVLKRDSGRVRVIVWNLGETTKTGVVEVVGARLEGLPQEPFALGPRGSGPARFDCVLSPADDNAAESALVLTGIFNGKRSSRLYAPLMFERRFLAALERHPLDCNDPKFWRRNDSAHEYSAAWDEKEKAVRFHVKWTKPNGRWFFPVYTLKLPEESLVGARMVSFEVKTEQDKPENSFGCQYLMLVYKDGREARYITYQAPVGTWETRFAEVGEDDDLGAVTAFRLGANPHGSEMTFWLRNIAVLKESEKGK